MFLFIGSTSYFISYSNILFMRPRIKKGILVASTNTYRYIISKRLIIEVTYSFKKGIVREKTIDIRQTINQ